MNKFKDFIFEGSEYLYLVSFMGNGEIGFEYMGPVGTGYKFMRRN